MKLNPALRALIVLAGLGGGFYALTSTSTEAQANPGAAAVSTSITCAPNISWNPDAGQGLVACASGYSSVNVESESTTPVYFAWRSGTTKANHSTVGKKRCAGCTNGSAYQAEVQSGNSNLFCIASGSTDAGVVVSVECAR